MKRFVSIILIASMVFLLIGCVDDGNKNEVIGEPIASSEYPSQPITVIVPAGPGGGFDSLARAVASMSGQYLGQPMIVKNVPGASFTLGASEVMNSSPDGYTFVLSSGKQFSVTPHSIEVEYDPLTDVEYSASMAEVRWIWGANSKLFSKIGISDAAGFLEYVKANPGEIKAATMSVTTAFMFDLLSDAGYVFNLTSYPDASALAVAIANGEVDCGIAAPAALLPLGESGDIQFIMEISGKTGEPLMEDVPNAIDDFPEITDALGTSYITWYGLFGPVGMPEEVIKKMDEFIFNISEDDGFTSLVNKIGLVPGYHTKEEMEAVVADEYELVKKYFEKLEGK